MASLLKKDVCNARNASDKGRKITLSDCICPICMYIMVEPVTMPCRHELCMSCFKHNVQETSLTCPMCRMRIATWSRKAARNNKLIDEKRWKEIQEAFPDKVKKRLDGVEDDNSSDDDNISPVSHPLAKPGEIKREYEEQLKKLREEQEACRQAEEEESRRLIQQLQADEIRQQLEQQKLELSDEALARELEEALNKAALSTPDISKYMANHANSKANEKKITFLDKYLEKCKKEDRYPYYSISPSDKENANTKPEIVEAPTSTPSRGSSVSYVFVGSTESSRLGDFDGETIEDLTLLDKADISNMDETIQYDLNETILYFTQKESGNQTAHVVKSDGDSRPSSQRSSVMEKFMDAGRIGQAKPRSESTTSRDSITQELLHFKPIHVCPKTPPKRMPSGQLLEPKLVRSTPVNQSRSSTASPGGPACRSPHMVPGGSPIMQRRLQELAAERQTNVWKNSKSTGMDDKEVLIMQDHSYSSPKKPETSGKMTLQQFFQSKKSSASTSTPAPLSGKVKASRKLSFLDEMVTELLPMPQLPDDYASVTDNDPDDLHVISLGLNLLPLESNLDEEPEDDHLLPLPMSRPAASDSSASNSLQINQESPVATQVNSNPQPNTIDVTPSGAVKQFLPGRVYMMKLKSKKGNSRLQVKGFKNREQHKGCNTEPTEPGADSATLAPGNLEEGQMIGDRHEQVEKAPVLINRGNGEPQERKQTPTEVKSNSEGSLSQMDENVDDILSVSLSSEQVSVQPVVKHCSVSHISNVGTSNKYVAVEQLQPDPRYCGNEKNILNPGYTNKIEYDHCLEEDGKVMREKNDLKKRAELMQEKENVSTMESIGVTKVDSFATSVTLIASKRQQRKMNGVSKKSNAKHMADMLTENDFPEGSENNAGPGLNSQGRMQNDTEKEGSEDESEHWTSEKPKNNRTREEMAVLPSNSVTDVTETGKPKKDRRAISDDESLASNSKSPVVTGEGASIRKKNGRNKLKNTECVKSSPKFTTESKTGIEMDSLKPKTGTEIDSLKPKTGTEMDSLKPKTGTELDSLVKPKRGRIPKRCKVGENFQASGEISHTAPSIKSKIPPQSGMKKKESVSSKELETEVKLERGTPVKYIQIITTCAKTGQKRKCRKKKTFEVIPMKEMEELLGVKTVSCHDEAGSDKMEPTRSCTSLQDIPGKTVKSSPKIHVCGKENQSHSPVQPARKKKTLPIKKGETDTRAVPCGKRKKVHDEETETDTPETPCIKRKKVHDEETETDPPATPCFKRKKVHDEETETDTPAKPGRGRKKLHTVESETDTPAKPDMNRKKLNTVESETDTPTKPCRGRKKMHTVESETDTPAKPGRGRKKLHTVESETDTPTKPDMNRKKLCTVESETDTPAKPGRSRKKLHTVESETDTPTKPDMNRKKLCTVESETGTPAKPGKGRKKMHTLESETDTPTKFDMNRKQLCTVESEADTPTKPDMNRKKLCTVESETDTPTKPGRGRNKLYTIESETDAPAKPGRGRKKLHIVESETDTPAKPDMNRKKLCTVESETDAPAKPGRGRKKLHTVESETDAPEKPGRKRNLQQGKTENEIGPWTASNDINKFLDICHDEEQLSSKDTLIFYKPTRRKPIHGPDSNCQIMPASSGDERNEVKTCIKEERNKTCRTRRQLSNAGGPKSKRISTRGFDNNDEVASPSKRNYTVPNQNSKGSNDECIYNTVKTTKVKEGKNCNIVIQNLHEKFEMTVVDEGNNNVAGNVTPTRKGIRSIEDKENEDDLLKTSGVKKEVETKIQVVLPKKEKTKNEKYIMYTPVTGGKKLAVRKGEMRQTRLAYTCRDGYNKAEEYVGPAKGAGKRKKQLFLDEMASSDRQRNQQNAGRESRKKQRATTGQIKLDTFYSSLNAKSRPFMLTIDGNDVKDESTIIPDNPRKERKHFASNSEFFLYTEEQDRLLALQLQVDFDMEMKYKLTSIRTKGSAGEYSLRSKNSSSRKSIF